MGVFDFLKGKGNEPKETKVVLSNPVNGKVIPIDEVDDPVFSQKMMGDGFGVVPSDGDIYSPGSGKVVSVFPTQHAVGLELDNGIEVLVHIGIDTVELEGGPFDTLVKEGDTVTPETKISTVDLEGLKAAGKENTVIIVFTNMDQVGDYDLSTTGETQKGAEIGSVSSK
ncbi:PTS sugar transporter subunit IIA [Alkalibacterium pelagium]|jgi:PTS system glucose-specific IIA component|uniref:PTS system IIA component, Glc family (TC 4.A.1) n=1 Tax=Alkalibacterium pelagium TaxID=426702 RepID=A0A1H7F4M7_9LACT|nr:PTS glucose transporter subunit IIA [Alkalibacterium pelagium]GEN49487.1 PTS N-acetylglucosamine transporter subunit IIABC [Alkalibacterium pelagium]SEK20774.1 PTS system IIA component, Glc family (TC 4.A.1) [Alkalibacterium pelagium]